MVRAELRVILRHEARDVARVLIPLAFVAIFRSLGFTLSEMRRHRGSERRKSFSDVPFERITLAIVLRIAWGGRGRTAQRC